MAERRSKPSGVTFSPGLALPEMAESRGNGQMHGLLSEFRGLYESKLQRLDEADKAGENTQKVHK